MGFLSWLFGSGWQISDNGNPTRVVGRNRVTVFAWDRGYKFCVADARHDDEDPFFSDPYETEEQAKDSALAYIAGRPSPHTSLVDDWQKQRTIRARNHLDETVARLAGLARDAIAAENITDLRKVEAKAASFVKSMGLALDRSPHNALSRSDISKAEQLRDQATRIQVAVQKRIEELKAR